MTMNTELSAPTRKSRSLCFGGYQDVYEHASTTLSASMRLGVYLPPQVEVRPCPVVYWLSGLTCTEQNFITKAGAQRIASNLGLILVVPDTSARGPNLPDDASADLGQGAGFYLNATQVPWAEHFRMYDYVVSELPALMRRYFPASEQQSIFGHSMGGHGALVCALRNPGAYRSVSAFAPIANPSNCPWGRKAFAAYLGNDEATWRAYDAVELIKHAAELRAAERSTAEVLPLLIDQGTDDEFIESQLMPERLEMACHAVGHPITLRRQPGYDHSYYFISSFIEEHLTYHAAALR